tara:strand:- start:6065 stop:7165 length:1101 start_codon:yes stop_codon:yes gene_type:complete
MCVMSEDQIMNTYSQSGVDTDAAGKGLSGLLRWVSETREFTGNRGKQIAPSGFFANVLEISENLSVAISTDGVGSKSVLAQITGNFEIIGWDCIAVNVNDIICTGAMPLAIVDYIALQYPHEDLLSELGRGMRNGAKRANVAVVGGELSQHPDTLIGPRDGYAFDISATCIGLLDRPPVTGSQIEINDVILGFPSNGIHANGLTLARQIFQVTDLSSLNRRINGSNNFIGEELLRPTAIYVPQVKAMLDSGVDVHGLAHISGDGFLNLLRLDANVTYRIDNMLTVPNVFNAIQQAGKVSIEEMFHVFNMGVGFCAVVPQNQANLAISAIKDIGDHAQIIGYIEKGDRQVIVEDFNLLGIEGGFSIL